MRAVNLTFWALTLFLFIAPVCGEEVWEPLYTEEAPWSRIQSVASDDERFYVLGQDKRNKEEPFSIWISTDGKGWKKEWRIPSHDLWLSPYLAEHEGKVFLSQTQDLTELNRWERRLFRRSESGLWDLVYEDEIDNSAYHLRNAQSFMDHLYFVDICGSMFRTTGLGNPIALEPLDPLPPPLVGPLKYNAAFAVFNDFLYVVSSNHDGIRTIWPGYNGFEVNIFRSQTGKDWEKVGSFGPEIHWAEMFWEYGNLNDTPRLTAFKDKLYLSYHKLRSTKGGEKAEDHDWVLEKDFDSPHLPLVLFDQLHVVGPSIPISRYNPLTVEAWELTNNARVSFEFGEDDLRYYVFPHFQSVAKLGNRFLVGTRDALWSFTYGAFRLDLLSVANQSLYSGQKEAPVLGFLVQANGGDKIQLVIKNLGEAEAGKNIERVKLINGKKEVLAELVTDPQYPKRWSMTRPVSVLAGDQLFITVDTVYATHKGATCIFSIGQGDVQFENNPGFQLNPPLVSPVTFKINDASLAPATSAIPDILIYPQPAKDQAHFLYSLGAVSDVTISLYDQAGHLVLKAQDPNKPADPRQTTFLDTSSLSPNFYFALIDIRSSAGNRTIKKKVFIQR